jgi:iron complex outermembrane recepter protein
MTMINSATKRPSINNLGCCSLIAVAFGFAAPAWAQTSPSPLPEGSAAQTSGTATSSPQVESEGLSDIVVTAQKRGVAERAQSVPVAITALNAAALQEKNVTSLSSLTASIPNVSLDGSGTFNGQANFEIRGFGISSSIPSVEPSVGVFIDGVYQGQTLGIITDLFDIDSIEVLRGPQGTLFGRNTTGGAVSINTRRPGDTFALAGKLSLESGPLVTAAASVEGPLGTPDLRGKITVYSSHDAGYYHNRVTDSKYGASTTLFVRPTLTWDITDRLNTTLIGEIGHIYGDGPPGVNSQVLDKFNVDLDNEGNTDIKYRRLTSETNLKVDFGDGTITNVFGYSRVRALPSSDVDGLPQPFFSIDTYLRQHQISEELRYAGTFGRLKVTVGAFYYAQKYFYLESRRLNAGPPIGFGGQIDQKSAAGFGQLQFDLTERFSLIAGGRYSWERKSAEVATYNAAAPRCSYATLTCQTFNFPGPPFADDGTNSWSRFSPKAGFQYRFNRNAQLYFTYSEGVRSGGYNIRSTVGGVSPGPYDQEIQNSYELGFKSDLFNHKVRLNGAAFYNRIKGLQRDITVADPVVGSAQITANAGTAEIYGGEGELTWLVVPGLTVGTHFGYLKGKYQTLTADLNGSAPGLGYELQLVRLPSWSYGANLSYKHELANGATASLNTDYGHVDRAAAQDNNTAFLSSRNLWNGNIAYKLANSNVTLSVFAKNLLNDVTWVQASSRAPPQGGGVFLTLARGRSFGGSVDFKF